jgi:hypothetical protein
MKRGLAKWRAMFSMTANPPLQGFVVPMRTSGTGMVFLMAAPRTARWKLQASEE